MGDELATSNVNRSYSLAATSIAIFTFMLIFLYPRFASGEVNALLFQVTLVVMGVATFSFVFASFFYYCSSLGSRIDDAERALYSRRGDRFWLLGYILLFLDPSLILFTVGLFAVGLIWFALWLVYLLFVIRHFPRVQIPPFGRQAKNSTNPVSRLYIAPTILTAPDFFRSASTALRRPMSAIVSSTFLRATVSTNA
jgi:hypothetical protein